jgi:hypothetical protein
MAVAFNKFQDFVESLGLGEHNLDTGVLKVYVTDNTPDTALDADKSDLTGATEENGYAAMDITGVWAESGGTGTLTSADTVVITASGGTVGPFQYVVLYNSSHGQEGLIGWWDYGSSITLQNGETFTIDFGASILTIV